MKSLLTGAEICPIDDNPEVFQDVMTVKGIMKTFGVKQARTVVNHIYTGRLNGAKLDAPFGTRGGIWLINAKSAYKLWGINDDNT